MQPTRAAIFVDWDTACRIVSIDFHRGREGIEIRAVTALQTRLATLLTRLFPGATLRTTMRIYHGWHRGKTKTAERNAFDRLVPAEAFARRIGSISFAPEVYLVDQLLCGGPRSVLLDTLRRREPDQEEEQKMVDTAIVSDLLHFVRTNSGEVAIVVGDDDDLLPGVITASAWGARVYAARVTRLNDNRFLQTGNLIQRLIQD